jgi:hypothetical protein
MENDYFPGQNPVLFLVCLALGIEMRKELIYNDRLLLMVCKSLQKNKLLR